MEVCELIPVDTLEENAAVDILDEVLRALCVADFLWRSDGQQSDLQAFRTVGERRQ